MPLRMRSDSASPITPCRSSTSGALAEAAAKLVKMRAGDADTMAGGCSGGGGEGCNGGTAIGGAASGPVVDGCCAVPPLAKTSTGMAAKQHTVTKAIVRSTTLLSRREADAHATGRATDGSPADVPRRRLSEL